MANIAVTRVMREIREIRGDAENSANVKVELIDEACYTRLRGEINGPPDTPYQGGRYVLEINIPDTYPFQPPKVHFITKIWHPNISSVTGAICLDVLKDQCLIELGWCEKVDQTLSSQVLMWNYSEVWLNRAAAMTLRTVLLSIQTLLANPEPDDPQDAVVASQYKDHFQIYQKTARHWAYVYASSNKPELDYVDKVLKLSSMGIEQNRALTLLSSNLWNVEHAIEQYFN